MANPEHLSILEQGVEKWNQWGEEHPKIKPDLSWTNFPETNFYEVNFNETDLSWGTLDKADLRRVTFNKACLKATTFIEANLCEADLRDAILGYTYHEGESHNGLPPPALVGWTDFSGANLSNANLSGTDLSDVALNNVNLMGANLQSANLSTKKIDGLILDNAKIGFTTFGNMDLGLVKGLDTLQHQGPSTIGIDTLYQSIGKVPEIFLRGCGVPEQFITYIPSLVGQVIQYYSCFISYSSKDQAFAERLHADLQSKGVRCWFAPEDMKIGDRFRVRIDESIRVHEKVLLILSENSVASEWVEKEVETAMENEREGKKTVLFPVRLDGAVNAVKSGWAADIRRTRHIGDFSNWKSHDEYGKVFERLLRDLKIEA